MPDRDPSNSLANSIDFSARRLKLDTLVRLRWLAVLGQAIAVLVVWQIFRFDLPVVLCLLVIAASAVLNLYLRIRHPGTLRVQSQSTAGLLAMDLIQLAALLYLTGGLQNPFAFLLLGPVMISAMSLPINYSVLLGVLMIGLSTALAIYHLPLPWGTEAAGQIQLPEFYVWGIWSAMVCCLLFIGLYAFRVSTEMRSLANALSVTELALAREQHLSALDGLAAAAAHELGTPLSTIALVSKELSRELGEDAAISEDLELLQSQTQRCREILGKLTSLSTQQDREFIRMPFRQMLEEISSPHRNFGIEIELISKGDGNEPIISRNPAVLYGLGNLLENAVDHAENTVTLQAQWDKNQLTCRIHDDGPGFPPELLSRIGEPYLRERRSGSGLGLGIFIAKTLLERSGATVKVENTARARNGAVVSIIWPRRAIEIEPESKHSDDEKLSFAIPAI